MRSKYLRHWPWSVRLATKSKLCYWASLLSHFYMGTITLADFTWTPMWSGFREQIKISFYQFQGRLSCCQISCTGNNFFDKNVVLRKTELEVLIVSMYQDNNVLQEILQLFHMIWDLRRKEAIYIFISISKINSDSHHWFERNTFAVVQLDFKLIFCFCQIVWKYGDKKRWHLQTHVVNNTNILEAWLRGVHSHLCHLFSKDIAIGI